MFTVDWSELDKALRVLSGVPMDEKTIGVSFSDGSQLELGAVSPLIQTRVSLPDGSRRLGEPPTPSNTPGEFVSVSLPTLRAALGGYRAGDSCTLELVGTDLVVTMSQSSTTFSDMWFGKESSVITSRHTFITSSVSNSTVESLNFPEGSDTFSLDSDQLFKSVAALKPFLPPKGSGSSQASQYRFGEWLYLITNTLGVFTPNPVPELAGCSIDATAVDYLVKVLPTRSIVLAFLDEGTSSLVINLGEISVRIAVHRNQVSASSYLDKMGSDFEVELPAYLRTPASRVPGENVVLTWRDGVLRISGTDQGIGSSRSSFSQELPIDSQFSGEIVIPKPLLLNILSGTSEVSLKISQGGGYFTASFVDEQTPRIILTQLFQVERF